MTEQTHVWRPATCDACGSPQVKQVVLGMPTADLSNHPDVAIGGCNVDSDETEFACTSCGEQWTQESWLDLGEGFVSGGRETKVTATDLQWVPEIRARLIEAAERRQKITYKDLKADVGFPHLERGVGRLLDLITIDCWRRGEPTLASIAVNGKTGEVGELDWDDVEDERNDLFDWWAA